MDFCLLYFYGPEHLWTSCIHCSNNFKPFKISSIGTHHWGEVVTICRVKSYLRHLPMTPQNSNNVKEAGERNQLIALLLCFALTSQVLIEWLMLYFGSHCLSEGHTGQFYRSWFQDKADPEKKGRLSDASTACSSSKENELLVQDIGCVHGCRSFS